MEKIENLLYLIICVIIIFMMSFLVSANNTKELIDNNTNTLMELSNKVDSLNKEVYILNCKIYD